MSLAWRNLIGLGQGAGNFPYVVSTNKGDDVHYDGHLSTKGTCPTHLV